MSVIGGGLSLSYFPSLPATNAKRLRKGAKRRSNPASFSRRQSWIASLTLAMTN
jgi:hypothetical protein